MSVPPEYPISVALHQSPSLREFGQERTGGEREEHTLVLEEVTHARPTSEDELCDVFHDLGLCLWRHRREPFRETDFACQHGKVKVKGEPGKEGQEWRC